MGGEDPPDPPDGNESSSTNSSTTTLTEGAIGGATGGARPRTSGGASHYDRIWPKNSSANMTSARGQDRSRGSVTKANGPDRRDILKRKYAQIIAEAEEVVKSRQTLILKLNKEHDPENSQNVHPNLNQDDLGFFIFDVLKINPDDVVGLDLYTGRYDTRDIS